MSSDGRFTAVISGFFSGVISNALFYPLDTIENRQQIDPRVQNRSLPQTFAFVYKHDGLFGFFVGWQAGLLGVGFNWAAYFLFYEYFNGFLGLSSIANDFLRGILAGVLTSILINPFWVVKASLIHLFCKNLETTENEKVTKVIKKIYRADGLKAFFAGVYPSMWGCSQSAIQFMLYPHIKASDILSAHFASESFLSFLAGSIAGLISTVVTYPYLTIRTRCQISSGKAKGAERTLQQNIRNMYKEGGFRIFYRGMTMNLIRQVPTVGILLCVDEMLRSFMTG